KPCSEPPSSGRTEHIKVCHHFILGLIAKENTGIFHVVSENQVADILTKALPKENFCKHVGVLLSVRP
ncbi:unnamed protein product, partial [Discosporangium mesarthrocarpum]